MDKTQYNRFAPVIRSLTQAELAGADSLFDKLMLAEEGALRVCYAPFEFINNDARVVIVGITPGRTQMLNALREAQHQMQLGVSDDMVLCAAKATGAFSGTMRPNLTGLLDAIGIHQWLGIPGSDGLFGASAHMMQTTSVLRNPVFVNGENYNGAPSMTRNPVLRQQLIDGFGQDLAHLRNAVFVPLGDKVSDALHWLSAEGLMPSDRILDGLPHPSGANAERIAYFLGRKSSHDLSAKTNASKLDVAKRTLMDRVSALT